MSIYNRYPNSLLRLLAAAVSALPPPYLFLKSAFKRSKKATETCFGADSFATTQYAAKFRVVTDFNPNSRKWKYKINEQKDQFASMNILKHQIYFNTIRNNTT